MRKQPVYKSYSKTKKRNSTSYLADDYELNANGDRTENTYGCEMKRFNVNEEHSTITDDADEIESDVDAESGDESSTIIVNKEGVTKQSPKKVDRRGGKNTRRKHSRSASVALQESFNEYKRSMTGRDNGAIQPTTIDHNLCGIRFFLKGKLNRRAILSLNSVGKEGGFIEQNLKWKEKRPITLNRYLGSLINYMRWLSGCRNWLEHLQLDCTDILTLRQKLKTTKQTLKYDIQRDKIQRARRESGLDIKAWMVAKYLYGPRPPGASSLLKEADGRTLKEWEILNVRAALCLQLILYNAKRSGDVAHIRTKDLEFTKPQIDGNFEFEVYDHKEARTGQKCYIRVSGALLQDLKRYRDKCRGPKVSSQWLFTSRSGGFIQPSAMAKIIRREWERHSRDLGQRLPRLTAGKNRKLVITIHREADATREQQIALAKHMAHRVTTADRYYDLSDRQNARHQCLDVVQQNIRVRAYITLPPCVKDQYFHTTFSATGHE